MNTTISNNRSSGNIIVISAPSGAGKSSLVKSICACDRNVQISISHTTRPRRANEVEGQDYYFITSEQFNHMLETKQFIEHAKVYDNFYGTHYNTLTNMLQSGHDVILEIDWQGAYQVRNLCPESTLIFIMPPSLTELERRLVSRNTDDFHTIKKRLETATLDIAEARNFDFVVVNDNFTVAVQNLCSIILSQRFKAKKVLNNM